MKRQIIRVEPHANINSHRKRGEDQIPRLREEPGDGDGRCHANDVGRQSKTCLVQRCMPVLSGKNSKVSSELQAAPKNTRTTPGL